MRNVRIMCLIQLCNPLCFIIYETNKINNFSEASIYGLTILPSLLNICMMYFMYLRLLKRLNPKHLQLSRLSF